MSHSWTGGARNARVQPAMLSRTRFGAALNASLLLAACQLVGSRPAPASAVGQAQASAVPAAPPLSASERLALEEGRRVERPMVFSRAGRRYLGGVSYSLVGATASQVFYTLNELDTLGRVLGGTRRIELLERSATQARVELEQGNALVSTAYTVIFEFEPPTDSSGGRLVRYWLDPSRPHDIEDVWGFFRLTPWPGQRTLVSVGAALNLGPGLLQRLLGGSLQGAILRTPRRVRRALEESRSQRRAQYPQPRAPSQRL